MNATRLHWWLVHIDSGNGLVPSGNKPLLELSGNKPLPEPMLTQVYVTIWRSPCQTRRTVGSVIDHVIASWKPLRPSPSQVLSNDLPIMMSPTAIKLVLSCLWYRNASVSANMFSDCRNLIVLKPINLRWIVATKCVSGKTAQSR